MMIEPNQYYGPGDHPSKEVVKRMWRAVDLAITPRRGPFLFIRDRRSFAYGMAAAVLLYLSILGAVTFVRQLMEGAQPQVVKIDRAYESAITEFERVIPSVMASASKTSQTADKLMSRKEQLLQLDSAIADLRQQTNGIAVSPITRERLRQLYSLKLQILQQMIEQGEIEP